MKHIVACCLILALLLSLCGCGGSSAQTEPPLSSPEETEYTAPTQETAQPTIGETVEIPPEGILYFTVSQLNFSLVGESENIYIGTVDPSAILWESADPNVVTVENGVLTATGAGTTTVTATCGGQTLSCEVSCLAATQEELEAMEEDILRSPKRLPPVVENPPLEFFDDAALVGDSISYILFQHEAMYGHLGNPLFLARGGCSLNGFVRYYKNIYYQGHEMKLEDAIAASGVNKVFIMLGNNDLGYRTIEETMESWDLLLSRIREQSPDVTIILQSCIPEWTSTDGVNDKNVLIQEYNVILREYAKENNCLFIDMWPYAVDHTERMPDIYSMDNGIHMNQTGSVMWMQTLNAYALLYMNGGTLQ